MIKFSKIILILFMIFFLQNCKNNPALEPDITDRIEVTKSSIQRNINPEPSSSEMETLINSNSKFAFEMYKTFDKDKNLVYSPISISLAFALLHAGASENSQKKIEDILHFDLENDKLHTAFNKLDLDLMKQSDTDGITLNISNRVWGEKTLNFNQEYLDFVALNYGANLGLLDFQHQSEESRIIINKWVMSKTNDKIDELLPKYSITSDTFLVLTNAIYFLGEWLYEFDKSKTEKEDFKSINNEINSVDFMKLEKAELKYKSFENFEAIELPYKDDKMSMLVIMPHENTFSDFEDGMNQEIMTNIQNNLRKIKMNLHLPKWKIEFDASILRNFKMLGADESFRFLDVSKICNVGGMITGIFHNAYINVDEKGSEAAAATAIVFGKSVHPDNMIETMKINKPFIFYIIDNESNSILFMGRVINL